MKNETIIYFAYGANLDRNGMDTRCPGNKPLCRAMLKNHRLTFKSFADIKEAVSHNVHGALYEITKEHLRSLDRFEGYPRFYIRKTVPVITEDSREIQAVVYQMTDRNHYSSPHRRYLDIILTGCQQWRLPEEYIQYIVTRAQKEDFGEQ